MCSSIQVRWWTGTFMSVVVLVWTVLSTASCPSMCNCKWKGGKEWVECANRNLKTIPIGAREETQVLDLSNNPLVILPSECFYVLGLVNLQRLYLSESSIGRIASRAFIGLVGLVELDLSGNTVEDIPTETFASYPSLMRLILNRNPIRVIHQDTFQPLSQLTNLELSQCRLDIIEQGAFNGLLSLEWLRLDGNQLTHVPDRTLPLGGNLRGLTLHNNPWLCDCRTRAMQTWLKESAPAVPQESEPTCESPTRSSGKQIKSIRIGDLACLPRIHLEDRIEVHEADNVTLKCDVYAVPGAEIMWWFNGQPCDPKQENDSFAMGSTVFPRYVNKQRSETNTSSNFHIYSITSRNDGIYTCVAKNGAGSVEANLYLRVLFREEITVESPYDNPSPSHVAVIVAGVVLGTFIALGCLVGGIIFCVKKKYREKELNSQTLVPQNRSVIPITRDITSSVAISCREGNRDRPQPRTSINEHLVATLRINGEHRIATEASYASPVPKYFTEPDLINEVPGNTITRYPEPFSHYSCDRRFSNYKASKLSYLDHDGYPLNFGLPKVPFNASYTLPRLRHRMADGSMPVLPTDCSRDSYPMNQRLHRLQPMEPMRLVSPIHPIRHTLPTVDEPLQQPAPPSPPFPVLPELCFIPSPPAAYRGDTTPLSPASLTNENTRKNAAAIVERVADLEPPHHPESPDEGYVGDAMDV